MYTAYFKSIESCFFISFNQYCIFLTATPPKSYLKIYLAIQLSNDLSLSANLKILLKTHSWIFYWSNKVHKWILFLAYSPVDKESTEQSFQFGLVKKETSKRGRPVCLEFKWKTAFSKMITINTFAISGFITAIIGKSF